MNVITIQAPIEDVPFFEELEKQGANVEIFRLNRFEGLSQIVQATVAVSAAVSPLLIAYFKEQTARAKARLVIKDGRKIRLEGYSAEEINKILAEP